MAIKPYTHYQSADAFLPRAALEALNQPRHVQQGTVYVFASSKADAARVLDALGFHVTPRGLKVATGVDVVALTKAGMALDAAVYAMPKQGCDVVMLHSRPFRGQEPLVTHIGYIIGGYGSGDGPHRFVHTLDGAGSEVSDAMLDAARSTLDTRLGPIVLAEIGDDDLHAAIAAALAAREDTDR